MTSIVHASFKIYIHSDVTEVFLHETSDKLKYKIQIYFYCTLINRESEY